MAAVLRPELRIRPMRRGDLTEVAAIEDAAYPFPWSRGIFGDCLRVGYCCRVMEVDGEIAGYGILSVAAEEAHLLNLCVAPPWRRAGLARAMMEALTLEARVRRAGRVFLEVRPTNKAAIALYEDLGFRIIGRRPGYYPAYEGREDAVVMVLHLDGDDGHD